MKSSLIDYVNRRDAPFVGAKTKYGGQATRAGVGNEKCASTTWSFDRQDAVIRFTTDETPDIAIWVA